jgi:hypothetical protein
LNTSLQIDLRGIIKSFERWKPKYCERLEILEFHLLFFVIDFSFNCSTFFPPLLLESIHWNKSCLHLLVGLHIEPLWLIGLSLLPM